MNVVALSCHRGVFTFDVLCLIVKIIIQALSPDVDSFSDTELVNLTGMPSLGPLQDTHSVHQHQMFPTIYSTAPTAKYDAVS